jgi:hypothetical protein
MRVRWFLARSRTLHRHHEDSGGSCKGTPAGNVCSFFVQLSSSQLIRKQVPKGFTDMEDVDEQGHAYRGVDACFFEAFNDLRTKLLKNFDEEWPKLLQEWD